MISNQDSVTPNMVAYMVIQRALERCMASDPPAGIEHRLGPDASLLGDILGEMIYRKIDVIPLSAVSGKHLDALNRWIATNEQTG